MELTLSNSIYKEDSSTLEKELFTSDNFGYDYYILLKLNKIDRNNVNIIILIIEEAIQLCAYKQAKEYIDYLKNNLCVYNSRIRYLENKINEINFQYESYIRDEKNKIYIKELSLKDYITSIKVCDELFIKTNNYDYIYIKAKILYENNLLSESLNCFKLYIKLANFYLRESYIYIFFINNKLNNNVDANLCIKLVFELFEYQNLSIDLEQFTNILLSYELGFNESTSITIAKELLNNNIIKVKQKDHK